jgi:pimeloyl-ACP methyl ester carboxylesterase
MGVRTKTMNGFDVQSIRLVAMLVASAVLGLAPVHERVSLARSGPEWTSIVPVADNLPQHAVFVPRQLREARERGAATDFAQVLVALHGMGDSGPVFAAPLLAQAELDGTVVVAPRFGYGDWKALTVAQEDLQLSERILALLDALPGETDGARVSTGRVRLLGFSRGAQLAHRFALVHPERTSQVAVFSAGTYTLPNRSQREILPFGTADLQAYVGHPLDLDALREVHFWWAWVCWMRAQQIYREPGTRTKARHECNGPVPSLEGSNPMGFLLSYASLLA